MQTTLHVYTTPHGSSTIGVVKSNRCTTLDMKPSIRTRLDVHSTQEFCVQKGDAETVHVGLQDITSDVQHFTSATLGMCTLQSVHNLGEACTIQRAANCNAFAAIVVCTTRAMCTHHLLCTTQATRALHNSNTTSWTTVHSSNRVTHCNARAQHKCARNTSGACRRVTQRRAGQQCRLRAARVSRRPAAAEE